MKNNKSLLILLSAGSFSLLLTACDLVEQSQNSDAANAAPSVVNFNNYNREQHGLIYPNNRDYYGAAATPKKVVVPKSYHLSGSSNPSSHEERDKSWVNSQNPQEYTIELSSDEKASPVANVLQQAPRKQRTAEIKSNQDGKTIYQGLYGTYPDKESAEKALDSLPEKVKGRANIKQWNTIQDNTVGKSSIPAADSATPSQDKPISNNANNNSNS